MSSVVQAADIDCELRKLSNGMTLVVVPLTHVHRGVLHAQLAVGSRFESAADNGISHFLEHMLYRGTASYPSAHALCRAIERRGGALDAATACDTGTLTLTAPPEELLGLARTFAEVYEKPRFDGIDVERGIVHEEILESLDDDGRRIDADDLIREMCFEGHPLGYPITGSLEHIDGFTEARLRSHHERYYCGENSVVVAVGPLESERALDCLEASFGTLTSGQAPAALAPDAQVEGRFDVVRHAASQTDLRVAFRAPGWGDVDEPAVEVLVRLLDDGMSTRLYHRICDERGLCYDVSAGYEAYSDSGLLELCAETSHENAAEVLRELLAIVANLRDVGPTDDELQTTLDRFRWEANTVLDRPEALAEHVATQLQVGRPTSLAARAAQIVAVTREEVMEAAATWWRPELLNVIAVGLASKAQRRTLQREYEAFQNLA